MSRLVNIIRLGISRSWRSKILHRQETYSSSLIHCIMLYLLLRTKGFRLGFWVVLYFIISSLKKYIIHVFFWRLPRSKKKRFLRKLYTVKIHKERALYGINFLNFSILPTNLLAGYIWQYQNTSRATFRLSNPWMLGTSMSKFLINRHLVPINNLFPPINSFKNIVKRKLITELSNYNANRE